MVDKVAAHYRTHPRVFVEGSALDLRWSANDIRKLLAYRIRGHFIRRGLEEEINNQKLRGDAYDPDDTLISLAFESPMDWGPPPQQRPAYTPLSTLCRKRLLWLIELCKSAVVARPNRSGVDKITLTDLNAVLKPFGLRRIEDTVSEFKSLCPEIEELINAFADQLSGQPFLECHFHARANLRKSHKKHLVT